MILRLVTILYAFLGVTFALSPLGDVDLQIVRVVIPLITMMWFAYGAYSKSMHIPQGVIALMFFLILAWVPISLFYSTVPLWTVRKILFFYSLAPLFLVLVDLFMTQRHAVEKLVKAVVYGGGIVAFVGIGQFMAQFLFSHERVALVWAHITPFFLGGTFAASVATYNSWYVHVGGTDLLRAIAFFPDPHILSFYAGIILPFAAILAIHTQEKKWFTATLLIILVNVLTFSRGGEIALIIGVCAFILLIFPHIATRMRHFILVGAVCSLLVFSLYGTVVFDRFLSSFDPADTSATSRVVLWQEALESIQRHPFVGVGLGAYAATVNPRVDYRTPIYAHNTYLDIAVESGLIGLALWVVLMLRILFVLWRSRVHPWAQAGILSIVILSVHGFFDTPLFSIHIFTLMVFLIALGSYYEQQQKNRIT